MNYIIQPIKKVWQFLSINFWTHLNKIAVIILMSATVFVSCLQYRTINKQTKLLEIQTVVAKNNLERVEKREKVESTANWIALRNSIENIFTIYSLKGGAGGITSLPREQQILFFRNVKEILELQIKNPVLIEQKDCLSSWHKAIFSAQTMIEQLGDHDIKQKDKLISSLINSIANSIFSDIHYVWQKIIFDS